MQTGAFFILNRIIGARLDLLLRSLEIAAPPNQLAFDTFLQWATNNVDFDTYFRPLSATTTLGEEGTDRTRFRTDVHYVGHTKNNKYY